MNSNFRKTLRFCTIYGFSRTLYKVFGRLRKVPGIFKFRNVKTADKLSVGFVGCGQFSFATMSYFLRFSNKFYFSFAYDIDQAAMNSFCDFNNIPNRLQDRESVDLQSADILYIASNHHSHSEYAISALKRGISVYIEKPISVNWEQFYSLGKVIVENHAEVYVGYNRPFSSAITDLKCHINDNSGPFSLNCFVVGHHIGPEHWYRKPEEGTRVCGNLGHWLDLSIHLLYKRACPEYLDVTLCYSNTAQTDDDITIVLTSDLHDLITLTLTSRSEPFEGINESISFHQAGLIADIQDFRRAVFWEGNDKRVKRYYPKDVGHKRAILQPITGDKRNLEEIRVSTALMLEITDMVRSQQTHKRFVIGDQKYKWN
jgi:predicted dehydrogenase